MDIPADRPQAYIPFRALRLPDVMQRTGLSRSYTYKLVKDGHFPPPKKISDKLSVWDEREIDAWLAKTFSVDPHQIQGG